MRTGIAYPLQCVFRGRHLSPWESTDDPVLPSIFLFSSYPVVVVCCTQTNSWSQIPQNCVKTKLYSFFWSKISGLRQSFMKKTVETKRRRKKTRFICGRWWSAGNIWPLPIPPWFAPPNNKILRVCRDIRSNMAGPYRLNIPLLFVNEWNKYSSCLRRE